MKSQISPAAPLAMAVVLTSALHSQSAHANFFVHETVDATGVVGEFTSLALDAQGNPRISYFDRTNLDLNYASKSGRVWALETVDATGSVGLNTSLALDAQGNPHISYYDQTNRDLKYASKSSGAWTLETVDATGSVGAYTSLALDAEVNPHISYYDSTNGDLKYARKSGGMWTVETVDAPGIVGQFTSLALDTQGNPRISYHDATNGDLKYASKSGGVWTGETVDATGSVGFYTSLALDAQGNPRISYYDVTNFDLKYASKSGAVWTVEIVDAGGNLGLHTSLALDAQGNPRISYYDGTNTDLKYASKSGGVWTVETVDATGSAGRYTSLSLDAQGNPRISYFDDTNGDLKYTDSSVHVLSPAGGETWPVGSLREIAWSGVGPVDILLSADGGATFDRLLQGIQSSPIAVRVPHTPTRFARIMVERSSPLSSSISDSLFTIETSVALLNLVARLEPEGGATVSWRTDPGPADLAGYRLERRQASEPWYRTLVPLMRETSYRDADGAPGTRYRLYSVNGLGGELMLGEAALVPARPLAAWPSPYRGGELTLSFASFGGLGGGAGEVEISLHDVAGRRVATLVQGAYAAGYHQARWNGRDAGGQQVAAGLYFLRVQTAGQRHDLKLVVVP